MRAKRKKKKAGHGNSTATITTLCSCELPPLAANPFAPPFTRRHRLAGLCREASGLLRVRFRTALTLYSGHRNSQPALNANSCTSNNACRSSPKHGLCFSWPAGPARYQVRQDQPQETVTGLFALCTSTFNLNSALSLSFVFLPSVCCAAAISS